MDAQSKKELNELLAAVKVLLVAGKSVAKDGKVNLNDLPVIFKLIKDAQVLIEGFKGMKDIHLKPFVQEDAEEVLGQLFDIIEAVKVA